MTKIKEVIVVEGRYDKNTLSQVVDAVIIETGGFGVFSDREKVRLLRRLAEARGLIIFTDSDGAGFVIRNFLKGAIAPELIKNAYIPDIAGREKRKKSPSREGLLGVEGMSPQLLLDALRRAGATIIDEAEVSQKRLITKADLFAAGLSGRPSSSALRSALLEKLELPRLITTNALLDVLNATMTLEELLEVLRS